MPVADRNVVELVNEFDERIESIRAELDALDAEIAELLKKPAEWE